MTTEEPAESLLKAAGAVGSLIPQVAGIAIGISFLAYFSGWRDADAYFTILGSPWAISQLPASRLLYLSGGVIATLIIATFFSVHSLAAELITFKTLNRFVSIAILLAGTCLILSLTASFTHLSPKSVWLLANSSGTCFVLAAGGTIGELVFSLSENKLQWTPRHAFLIYIAIFTGIYLAPNQIGSARARFHLETLKESLPSVRLSSNNQNEDWRLVELIGESALLIDKPAMTTTPLFKIVKANEIISINALEKPEK